MSVDVVVIFERHGDLIASPPIGGEEPTLDTDPYGDTLWDWNLTDDGGASFDSVPPTYSTLYEAQAAFILAYGNIAGSVTAEINAHTVTITGSIASLERQDQ